VTKAALSDREARRTVEEVVDLWRRGEEYQAIDVVNHVYARGHEDGRKPAQPTLEQRLAAAEREVDAAEADLRERERELNRLRAQKAGGGA
jgi:hypothetical protein